MKPTSVSVTKEEVVVVVSIPGPNIPRGVSGDTLEWDAATNRWVATDRLAQLEQRVTALENLLP
jgi:hypothetical protein